MRSLFREELIQREKRCSSRDSRTLHHLLRHRCDGDVPHLNIPRLHLSCGHSGDEMVLIVGSHELRRERLREEVVVQRILLRDDLPIDGEPVVHPIR